MLDDDTIVVLSSTGPLQRDQVKMLLKSWWIWWDEYGQELVQFFDSLVPLFEEGLAMRPGVQTGVHGVSGELQFKKMEAPSIPIEDTFAEFKGPVVFVCCYGAVSKNGWEYMVCFTIKDPHASHNLGITSGSAGIQPNLATGTRKPDAMGI
ncbi:hypothetical protein EW026_g7779 [Hermanssonia centrifuga]|uniref:Uncharacterized protein n=1 Tax=Hermanssonia centrifuga TaxID=98765 RepID=A0A4S4K6P6_9APHY|nr:hypothetical protein EW026_g7779 [Hermanssonia centrifuga]